ncbi:MAG: DinB family protein [Terracidiphilus sp.]|nr:DinB family protein [Terracidiphilus sp.]MDR3798683.1 DinB family protein [Terracidiphilus sp.]
MSQLNPYDKFLGGQPPEAILPATSKAITTYLEVIGAERAMVPPTLGKWSAAEIVSHLADCEIVFAFRLRQTLAEDNPTIQPFDQDKWAAQYSGIPVALAVEAFNALRNWNLRLIQSALPAAAGKTMTHPERGEMTFQTVIETMAGHDLNHLAQLRHIAELTA